MKTALYIALGINIYISMAILTYAVLDHFDPYDEDNDPYDEGDTNKGVAFLWPCAIVVGAIALPIFGLSRVFDAIHKERKGSGE